MDIKLKLYILFILPLLCGCQDLGYFTNPYQLVKLFTRESEFVKLIQKHENNSFAIQHYLESYESVVEELKFTNVPEPYLNVLTANPIHVYNLMYRMTILRPHVLIILNDIPSFKTENTNYDEEFFPFVPSENDMIGVTLALLRVQFIYQYDPYEMSHGILGHNITHARLSAQDCFRIAVDRYSSNIKLNYSPIKEYAIVIEWAEASIRLLLEEKNLNSKLHSEIKTFLDSVTIEHDESFVKGNENNVFPNEVFFIDKISNHPNITIRKLREIEREFYRTYEYNSMNYYKLQRAFSSLCRGERIKIKNVESVTGNCRVIRNSDPYSILYPIKIEILSFSPILIQFHDIVNNKEIEYLQNRAKNELLMSAVEDDKNFNQTKHTFERTQSHAWLRDVSDPVIRKLSKKLAFYTNMLLSSQIQEQNYLILEAEALQVGIYAPGGHYVPHVDALILNQTFTTLNETMYVGNRIATLMLYLSNLEGGSTAFPFINRATKPVAGSAAFWYNLYSNYTIDNLSIHGACPTVLGIKWVGNKWIRSYAQIFKQPCSLTNGVWKMFSI